MDDAEIRVHPMAAAYMATLANCIEAAAPMVRAGLSYWECKDVIRAATIEALELNGMTDHSIEALMSIAQTAFKILSKKKRGLIDEM